MFCYKKNINNKYNFFKLSLVFSLIIVISIIVFSFFNLNLVIETKANTSICPLTSNQDLFLGSINEDVRNLQKYLNTNGFILAKTGPGSIGRETNFFGYLTRQALTNFQIAKNIPNVNLGGLDITTRRFLNCDFIDNNDYNLTKDFNFKDISEEVRKLQRFLNSNGYVLAQTGPGSFGRETNYFGVLTRAALTKFQALNDLKVNNFGSLDSQTRNFISDLKDKIKEEIKDLNISGDDEDGSLKEDPTLANNNLTKVYSLHGKITGLQENIILLNKINGDELAVKVDDLSAFSFAKKLASGEKYEIIIKSASTEKIDNQNCFIKKPIGFIEDKDITNLEVMCGDVMTLVSNPFTNIPTSGGNTETYTLTYNSGANGSIMGTSPQTIEKNSNGLAVAAVADTGYHFVSWSDGVTSSTRTDLNVSANISVTASFAIDTFTVNYEASIGGSVSGSATQIVNYNSSTTEVEAISDAGYTFIDWSDGLTTTKRTDLNITSDETYTANFSINTYTINYNTSVGGFIVGSSTQQVNYNENTETVTSTPSAGYTFIDWSDGLTTTNRIDLNITTNATYTANFGIINITDPLENDELTLDSNFTISGTSSLNISSIIIEASNDGGTNWIQIASTTSDGTWATTTQLSSSDFSAPDEIIIRVSYGVVKAFLNLAIIVPKEWELVGVSPFTGRAWFTSLEIDNFGVPYVAYADGSVTQRNAVKKFNVSAWETVGLLGFSGNYSWNQSLKFDNDNVPYLAFVNNSDVGRATVMKFDGANWVLVGSTLSTGASNHTSMDIDSNNVPYVAFQDGYPTGPIRVKKFDGTSWVNVGATLGQSIVSEKALAINNNDIPYVAFRDDAVYNKATVKKFNGTSWELVGTAGFTSGYASDFQIVFSSTDEPYLVFQDSSTGSKTSVMKYNGSNWEYVGNPGISNGYSLYQSIVLDSNNIPYVAQRDAIGGANGVTAFKFNGSTWENIYTYVSEYGTEVDLAITEDDVLYITHNITNGYYTFVQKLE